MDRRIKAWPVCRICGEHICDGVAYDIGGLICEDCVTEARVWLDD